MPHLSQKSQTHKIVQMMFSTTFCIALIGSHHPVSGARNLLGMNRENLAIEQDPMGSKLNVLEGISDHGRCFAAIRPDEDMPEWLVKSIQTEGNISIRGPFRASDPCFVYKTANECRFHSHLHGCMFLEQGMKRHNSDNGHTEYLVGNVRVWKDNKKVWKFQRVGIDHADSAEDFHRIDVDNIFPYAKEWNMNDEYLSFPEHLDAFLFLTSVQPSEIKLTYDQMLPSSRQYLEKRIRKHFEDLSISTDSRVSNFEKELLKSPPSEIKGDNKVTIVGAGPSGLMNAILLLLNGYNVTIYESREEFTRENRLQAMNNRDLVFFGHDLFFPKFGFMQTPLISIRKVQTFLMKVVYILHGEFVFKKFVFEEKSQQIESEVLIDASGKMDSTDVLVKDVKNHTKLKPELQAPTFFFDYSRDFQKKASEITHSANHCAKAGAKTLMQLDPTQTTLSSEDLKKIWKEALSFELNDNPQNENTTRVREVRSSGIFFYEGGFHKFKANSTIKEGDKKRFVTGDALRRSDWAKTEGIKCMRMMALMVTYSIKNKIANISFNEDDKMQKALLECNVDLLGEAFTENFL